MRPCEKHWKMLREAIDARGLTPLVARNAHEAMERTVEELEGHAADPTYDPLMAAYWMVMNRALEAGGLYLLSGDHCPTCEAIKHSPIGGEGQYRDAAHIEEDWTDGPADAALAYVQASAPLCALLGWEPKTDTNEGDTPC